MARPNLERNRRMQPAPTMAVVRFLILAAMIIVNVSSAAARLHVPPQIGGARTSRYPPRRGTLAFTLTMMGSRRGKGGNLKQTLDNTAGRGGASSVKGINGGRGQEITGVTLPEKGTLRGWAFGDARTVCAANVDGRLFAVDGACPRCAFDLFRGKLLTDADVWGPEPRVACKTCSVTYSLATGQAGPEYKSKGLVGFVNTWAKTATVSSAAKDATAFVITSDEDTGRVFCREQ